MQANGAEMLRLACCLATERGVEVCAPIHDAILVSAPFDHLDADIATTRAAMAEASHVVLDGFKLHTDVSITRSPPPIHGQPWSGHVGACHQPVAAVGRLEVVGMIEDPDPYADPKQHRLTPEMQAVLERQVARVPKKLQKRRQHFVMVPWAWAERLQGASGQTYRVAICLLYLHWRGSKSGLINLPNGMLKIDGISRQSKWRALTDLERRGLIVVEHRPRKSPLVRLNLSPI